MFLTYFRLTVQGELIREVFFRKGLNLILDVTSGAVRDSGNNVGKTTLLRCVDFCLGSSGKDLYTDAEFKSINDEVFEFLHGRDVVFHLGLSSNVSELHIERTLNGMSRINGEDFSEQAFLERIGRELFRLRGKKPSVRQLLNKFIRIGEHQAANTLRFLHPTTSSAEYEPVWLFLFGFDEQELFQRRRDLQSRLKSVGAQLAGFKGVSKSALRQTIAVVDRDLQRKQEQISRFDVGPAVKTEIDQLSGLREKITNISLRVSHLQVQVRSSERTIKSLHAAATNIDTSRLEELYSAANRELPDLSRKFSELQEFHNAMVKNKVAFVQENLDKTRKQLTEAEALLASLTKEESGYLKSISDRGSLADLNKVHAEINQLHENRGEKTGLLSRMEKLEEEKQEASVALQQADLAVRAGQQTIDQRLLQFNRSFSEYSRRLYGEEYILYCDFRSVSGVNVVEFKINNVSGNEGTGKKRAQVAAFDLAYLQVQSELNASTVRFTLHDRLESVSSNQLQTLFDIAENIDGQYLVCVLADKLASVDPTLVRNATVLRLSQEDKFFRLP